VLQGAEQFDVPLHIQVSQASEKARAAVAAAGGSVTTVYYNKLGARASTSCQLKPLSSEAPYHRHHLCGARPHR